MFREWNQLWDTLTCVGRLICPEGHVSSSNKSNPIQFLLLHGSSCKNSRLWWIFQEFHQIIRTGALGTKFLKCITLDERGVFYVGMTIDTLNVFVYNMDSNRYTKQTSGVELRYIDGLVQDCSNSIAIALDFQQSDIEPQIYSNDYSITAILIRKWDPNRFLHFLFIS